MKIKFKVTSVAGIIRPPVWFANDPEMMRTVSETIVKRSAYSDSRFVIESREFARITFELTGPPPDNTRHDRTRSV